MVVSQKPPAPGTRDALAVLDARGIPLLRTWRRGAIRLRWTPGGVVARGFLDGRSDGGSGMSKGRLEISNFKLYGLIAGLEGSAWSPGLVTALGLVLGLGACAALAVVEWGAWALVVPGRRPTEAGDDPGPGEPIEARAADGVAPGGDLARGPGGDGPDGPPGPRVRRGAGALRDRVEALGRHGWNVARLDLRGYGRSGGRARRSAVARRTTSAPGSTSLAARVGPPRVVALWGRSMGAAIAVRAAAEDPRVAALVLEAPYVDLEAAIASWLRRARVPLPRLFALLIAAGPRRWPASR